MQVKGLRAIVVGGASGMARASAEAIVAGGGDVAILDLSSSDGEAVAAELGGSTAFHSCDVTDFDGTETVLAAAAEGLGGLDATINTAGGGVARRTLSKDGPHPLDEFRSVLDLNLVSSFNINRVAASIMSGNEPNGDGERGVMINTASIAAFEGQVGQVAYSAAKAGIAGMCLTMARDLGSLGIRINAIAPSLFATGITKGIPDEFADALTKDAAFPKRLGKPEEYAKLAVSIIENPMLNGGCIRLDGGQRFAPR